MSTKDILIQEASKQFLKKGYEKTSINDITAACNITKGAFYHHFNNKDEIFMIVFDNICAEIKEWYLNRLKNKSSIEQFIKSFFNYDQYIKNSNFFKNINVNIYTVIADGVRRFPELKSKIYTALYSILPIFKQRIKTAQKQGVLKEDFDPEVFAFIIINLIEGGMFISTLTGDNVSIDNKCEMVANTIWNLIKK
ncbi:TetR/AcrR family transcriptional regulator [Iocasia frigidifontis]|nr:TetR/AcrR family transcriptional regulator [Iocasia fonsfrigidae]